MLGAARASQYAGWWSQGGPLSVTFSASGDLGYKNKQTPSYSYNNTGTESNLFFKLWTNNTGYVNTTNYTSNTDYNTYRWTHVMGFKLNLASGLATGDGITNTPRINSGSTTPNYGTMSWQKSSSGSLRIVFWASTLELSGTNYLDYNDKWYWVVYSGAETSTAYTNWSGTGSAGNYYVRLALFDESGALIGKQDNRQSLINGVVDITTWLTNAAGAVYTIDSENNMYNFNPSVPGNTDPNSSIKYCNYWYSWGTMFDPLTTTNTSWRTTRPSATIGTAVAWQNIQFVEYENPSTGNYYITAQGDDLWTQPDDRQAELMTSGNATAFTDRYSTTDIPLDIG